MATRLNATIGRGRYAYQDGLDADWLPLRFIGQSTFSEHMTMNSQEFRLLPRRLMGNSLG